MPNIKISAAADAGTLLGSDMLPLARSGNTNAYHATMAEIASFASVTVASGSYNNVGRNLLHNPEWLLQQRGAGPFTATGYTADRWELLLLNDTATVAIAAVTPGAGPESGDESQKYYLGANVTGSSIAGSYSGIQQSIEGVARTSNKSVTVSFWAAVSSGTANVGVQLFQIFGTGGSPSATVSLPLQVIGVGTAWARYSATFTVPSIVAKTLGTNGNDNLTVRLWFSEQGSAVGVQTANFGFWGMQLEIGTAVTPLQKLDYAEQVQNAQRFYSLGAVVLGGYATAGTVVLAASSMQVLMRASPTITPLSTSGNSNVGAITWSSDANQVVAQATVTATGEFIINSSYAASADF